MRLEPHHLERGEKVEMYSYQLLKKYSYQWDSNKPILTVIPEWDLNWKTKIKTKTRPC